MQNNMEDASRMQSTSFGMSALGATWSSLHKFVSGKAGAIRSTSETTSLPTTKMYCDKWRPAGIAILLKDRTQWADLGCQL